MWLGIRACCVGLKSGVDSVLVQRLLASESLILLSKTAQRAADVDGRRAVRLAFEVVGVMVVEGGGVEVEEDIEVGVVVAGVVGEGVVVVEVIIGVSLEHWCRGSFPSEPGPLLVVLCWLGAWVWFCVCGIGAGGSGLAKRT